MTETHYLQDILILLAAAIITVPLFQRFRLGSVLGYLVAGAIVGPWGFGFINEIQEIRHIAEFGVIFLLFLIPGVVYGIVAGTMKSSKDMI